MLRTHLNGNLDDDTRTYDVTHCVYQFRGYDTKEPLEKFRDLHGPLTSPFQVNKPYTSTMWTSQRVNNRNVTNRPPQQQPQQQQQQQQENNEQNNPTFGMTSAISTAAPKPSDIVKTSELEEALKPYDVFETEQELNHRMVILGKLYSLVRKWIKDVSIARNMPENVAEHVGGKIYTFGSYRLGVSGSLYMNFFKTIYFVYIHNLNIWFQRLNSRFNLYKKFHK